MVIIGPDHIAGPVQVIPECLCDCFFDLLLGDAVDSHKDHRSRCLRAFDPLGMIVGHFCRYSADPQHLPKVILAEPCSRGYAHRAPVSVTVIGFWLFLMKPHTEFRAVACKRIPASVFLHGRDNGFFHSLFISIRPAVHEPFRHRDGHDAVIRVLRSLRKKFKILGLNIVAVKFVRTSDHISQNSTVHPFTPFSVFVQDMVSDRLSHAVMLVI